MQKTKLGISCGAFAAITFLSGLVSFLVVALMAGYALLKEEDETLKKNVVKAVVFILVIGVFQALLGTLDSIVAFINTLISNIPHVYTTFKVPFGLSSLLANLVSIAEKLGLIIFAFSASKNTSVSIPIVDSFADKTL